MSAEEDKVRGRAEHGRRMRVRRIIGGIQITTGIVGVILFVVVVIVIKSERLSLIAFMAITGAGLWFAECRPVTRFAERIEAWLSSPP